MKQGDSIYAFEQVWAATIVKSERRRDGNFYHVHWDGFGENMVDSISEHQVIFTGGSPVSKDFLQKKAEETFKKNTYDGSDDENITNSKRRRP